MITVLIAVLLSFPNHLSFSSLLSPFISKNLVVQSLRIRNSACFREINDEITLKNVTEDSRYSGMSDGEWHRM